MMMPCSWVAHTRGLEQVLFAKLATLFLGARLVYLHALVSDALHLKLRHYP